MKKVWRALTMINSHFKCIKKHKEDSFDKRKSLWPEKEDNFFVFLSWSFIPKVIELKVKTKRYYRQHLLIKAVILLTVKLLTDRSQWTLIIYHVCNNQSSLVVTWCPTKNHNNFAKSPLIFSDQSNPILPMNIHYKPTDNDLLLHHLFLIVVATICFMETSDWFGKLIFFGAHIVVNLSSIKSNWRSVKLVWAPFSELSRNYEWREHDRT